MVENEIIRLSGPERVRKRPAVLFGAIGEEGMKTAIRLLLGIFETEKELGFCSGISVEEKSDGSVLIHSDDSGMVIDETVVDGNPAWRTVFCELLPAPQQADWKYLFDLKRSHQKLYGRTEEFPANISLHDDHAMELYVTLCASEFFRISAVRGGEKKTLEFRKGVPVGDVIHEQTNESNGTEIHLKLDREVFFPENT